MNKTTQAAGAVVTATNAAAEVPAIDRYTTDLTAAAKDGKLDPVIARDEQIRYIMQILARRELNNPLLIGEPGVGKTALIYGLAHRIVSGAVPENLKSCRLLALNVTALLSGLEFKGQLEERMETVLNEVTSSGKIILVIDDFGGIMKVESNIALVNMIKAALGDSRIRLILAAGIDDHKAKIYDDKMLSGRTQTVMVEEPSLEDTYQIMLGVRDNYEAHHGIRIPDAALLAAVKMAHRYQPSVSAPRGPISVIDNTGARLCIALSILPTSIENDERELQVLRLDKSAKKDKSKKARIEELAGKVSAAKEIWEAEKELVNRRALLIGRIASVEQLIEQENKKHDYERVSKLTHGDLFTLNKELAEVDEAMSKSKYVHDNMTVDDVASTIAALTGIPLSRMLDDEKARLLSMEKEMGKQVISQKPAITAICSAVRRARAGLQAPNKPVFSGIFLGTTGVGKTEVAKALARILFGDEDAMLRVDMSEYGEKHNVSRLYGPPPGYEGHQDGGQLTEFVRKKPYSVILFDEIEKAHPDVFNVFLQVLDDARLTDGKGRVVKFNNTIILMTSNIGAHHIKDIVTEEVRGLILGELAKRYKPEFLNRLDEKIIFDRLMLDDVKQIAKLAINSVRKLLTEQNMTLDISEQALEMVTKAGFDPSNGARPLARAVDSLLKNPISDSILGGKFKSGDMITVSVANKGDELELIFEKLAT